MRLLPTRGAGSAQRTNPAKDVERKKVEHAIAKLDTPPLHGPRAYVPNPLTAVTGPWRLAMAAGRMARRNVGVAAVLAGALFGGVMVGSDYYSRTRIPKDPAAGSGVLIAEIDARVSGSTELSMSDAHWCLNRLAQADDHFELEATLEGVGPSLVEIVRAAPPIWGLSTEMRHLGTYVLEATDAESLPRNDPSVRSLVDTIYPEVRTTSRDIQTRFAGRSSGADDARWAIERLAVFGANVREVMYRVDANAVAGAVTKLDVSELEHHEDFVRGVLAAASPEHPDALALAEIVYPGTRAVVESIVTEPDALTVLSRLAAARGDADVSFEHVLAALGDVRFAQVITAFPIERASSHGGTLRAMLDRAPSSYLDIDDDALSDRLATLQPKATTIVAEEVDTRFDDQTISRENAEALLDALQRRAGTSIELDWGAVADQVGRDRLIALLEAVPPRGPRAPTIRRLVSNASEDVLSRLDPPTLAAVQPHFLDETVMARAIAEKGPEVAADCFVAAGESFSWDELVRQLGPVLVADVVQAFPLDRVPASAARLKAFLRAIPDDFVAHNDPRAFELRLRLDDVTWSKVTAKTPGWLDHGENGVCFIDGPEIDDLKQGIGTCYLTSVIAAIADKHPEYLEEIVVDRRTIDPSRAAQIDASLPAEKRGQWNFAVRLFENTGGFLNARWILVEPRLPASWAPADGLPDDARARRTYWREHVFSRDTGPNDEVELYAGLIEQACTEFEWGDSIEKRYAHLEVGYPFFSMQWLLGARPDWISFSGRDADTTWDELCRAVDDRICVVRLDGHVRVVTGYETDGDLRTVRMYDTAPGAEMTMAWDEFRRVHSFVLHGEVPNDSTAALQNRQTAALYTLLAAVGAAIASLSKVVGSRSARAGALRTIRRAAERGLLTPEDRDRLERDCRHKDVKVAVDAILAIR